MNADVSSVASSADAPRENSEDMPLREKPPVALVLGGATGMLGQALTRAAAAKGWDVHTLGREDGPVTDPAFLEDAQADRCSGKDYPAHALPEQSPVSPGHPCRSASFPFLC